MYKYLTKRVAISILLLCISLIVVSFCACDRTNEKTISLGRYVLNDGVIEIKSDSILTIENIDFSSLQAEIDTGTINFNVSEYLQGDLEYITLKNDPTQIFIHMHQGLYATMVYDYDNQTIEFLEKIYYFEA